jgi:hypothetical protein
MIQKFANSVSPQFGAPQALQAASALAATTVPSVAAAVAHTGIAATIAAHGGLLAMGATTAPVAIPLAAGAGLLYLVSKR